VNRSFVVATRHSRLALAQTRAVLRQLRAQHPGVSVRELHVTTTGDRVQDRSLQSVGGKGLFVKEVEEAILSGRADFAVHSMKDLPAEVAPTLVVGCIPVREDPRDAVVTRQRCPLAALPPGARVGTSSLRRRVQLQVFRPDLEVVPLRGNVDTRLRRCHEGVVDAVLLARAGLVRLGLLEHESEILDPDLCLPAVGQGALAVEHRAADTELRELLEPMIHSDTAVAVAAERGVMLAVAGSCQIPVAALAVRHGAELWLRGMLAEPDGSRLRRAERRVSWTSSDAEAHQLGLELGRELRRLG
jgi:hydroxymethylbilane synthase